MTSSDRFPLSGIRQIGCKVVNCLVLPKLIYNRALNTLTVQASTTKLSKLLQIFTMRAEKKFFRRS